MPGSFMVYPVVDRDDQIPLHKKLLQLFPLYHAYINEFQVSRPVDVRVIVYPSQVPVTPSLSVNEVFTGQVFVRVQTPE